MGSEPVAKCDHKRWVWSQIRNGFGRTNSASNEMMMKELYSELGVVADLSALEMRASATPKMAAKGIEHGEIAKYTRKGPPSVDSEAELPIRKYSP
jgi:hypothetical protein